MKDLLCNDIPFILEYLTGNTTKARVSNDIPSSSWGLLTQEGHGSVMYVRGENSSRAKLTVCPSFGIDKVFQFTDDSPVRDAVIRFVEASR